MISLSFTIHPLYNHAIMKVREHCFEGTLQETPVKVAKGHLAMENAIPCSEKDTYKQRKKVGEQSRTKAAHLQQMHFVPKNVVLNDSTEHFTL